MPMVMKDCSTSLNWAWKEDINPHSWSILFSIILPLKHCSQGKALISSTIESKCCGL